MSTGPKVIEQLNTVIAHHQRVHHHSVREARRVRAARAAVAAAQSPESVQVPDLQPEGMPGVDAGTDPLAGL